MNLLVIGASSFTGGHFCTYARKKGATVDEVSLRNLRAVVAALERGPSHIVNFAALNVVAPSWLYPSDYLFTNTYALTSIVDMLKTRKVERFVQVSTPEVYGSTSGWIKEDAPYNPSTPYAVSRAAAEMMLKAYRTQYAMPIVITRGCNVYGPGQQLYRLIPKLIVSIKKQIPFPLEGGGTSARAFLHVEDMCAGIWQAMQGEGDYHISARELQPIEAIVTHVAEKMGRSPGSCVELTPERPGKDAAYMLDSGRLRASGWEDTVSMDQGISEVIRWVEKDWDTLQHESMEYEHRP